MKNRNKIAIALLVSVLIVCAAASALATAYGEAVIDGRDAAMVHLRERATVKSDSMGRFYTGTQVDCLSDPDEEWVHVRVGLQEGYMMGRYLRTGSRADRVTPVGPTGYVDVKNYIRLRRGPSTEYKMLAALQAGTDVIILGVTDNNWYYVDVNGEDGYVSANLITLHGQMPPKKQATGEPASMYTLVNQAYRGWVARNGRDHWSYAFVSTNGDDVPELVVDTGEEAGGCYLLSYDSGVVYVGNYTVDAPWMEFAYSHVQILEELSR